MYQQRAPVSTKAKRPRETMWEPPPDEQSETEELKPRPGDIYAVVDDIAEGRVKLVIAPWPRLDGAGRLLFIEPTDSTSRRSWRSLVQKFRPDAASDDQSFVEEIVTTADQIGFQAAADAARDRKGQLKRDLRIGDAFRVRRVRTADPAKWKDILDVTPQAREAAKAALLAAVAPKLEEGGTEALVSEMEQPSPPTAEQVAGPSL